MVVIYSLFVTICEMELRILASFAAQLREIVFTSDSHAMASINIKESKPPVVFAFSLAASTKSFLA